MLTFSHVENKFQSSYQCLTHTSFKATLLVYQVVLLNQVISDHITNTTMTSKT